MADDFLDVLARFHRDILMPEVREAIRESEQRQLDATLSQFDTIDRRFDKLEDESHALAASVGRIELRIGCGPRSIRTAHARRAAAPA